MAPSVLVANPPIPILFGSGLFGSEFRGNSGGWLRLLSPGFFLFKTFEQLLAFCGDLSLPTVIGEVPGLLCGGDRVLTASRLGARSSKGFQFLRIIFAS